jgi:hypothetical protein
VYSQWQQRWMLLSTAYLSLKAGAHGSLRTLNIPLPFDCTSHLDQEARRYLRFHLRVERPIPWISISQAPCPICRHHAYRNRQDLMRSKNNNFSGWFSSSHQIMCIIPGSQDANANKIAIMSTRPSSTVPLASGATARSDHTVTSKGSASLPRCLNHES